MGDIVGGISGAIVTVLWVWLSISLGGVVVWIVLASIFRGLRQMTRTIFGYGSLEDERRERRRRLNASVDQIVRDLGPPNL